MVRQRVYLELLLGGGVADLGVVHPNSDRRARDWGLGYRAEGLGFRV